MFILYFDLISTFIDAADWPVNCFETRFNN